MSRVVIHKAPLDFLLNNPVGPLGQYIDRKADAVLVKAKYYASGNSPGPQIRRPDEGLQQSLTKVGVRHDEFGLAASVGTANLSPRQGFNYPLALESGEYGYRYPYLSTALEDEFAG